MSPLMPFGFALLILGLAAGSTGASAHDPASEIAAQGRDALASLREDLAAGRRAAAREQLHSVLPAQLAAAPIARDGSAAVIARARVEHPAPRKFTFTLRGQQGQSERATLRWQSLLPGMMK